MDNYGTHKTPLIWAWLTKRPRFHVHFTPTYASWLNLIERWFAELTTKQLDVACIGASARSKPPLTSSSPRTTLAAESRHPDVEANGSGTPGRAGERAGA